MRSVRVRASGRVQGVGYRWHVRDAAAAHGVRGWVRNAADGAVEAELHGQDADVDAVLEAMRAGPAHGRVDELHVSDAVDDGATGFDIRR